VVQRNATFKVNEENSKLNLKHIYLPISPISLNIADGT
jgi:hypothetical protein